MRSLWPREHGAYAQLGLPLAATLIAAASVPAVLLTCAACSAFLSNEPLLVLLGHRGKRARQQLAGRATRRLAVLAGIATIATVAGLALAPIRVLGIAAIVAAPAAALIALGWTRAAHSLWGELVAAIALPGASAPVAVAAGMSVHGALQLWLPWSLGFMAAVVAVHLVLARRRTRLLAVVPIALACAAPWLPALLIALPLAGLAAVVAAIAPAPRRLREIGAAMVIAGAISCVPYFVLAGT